MTAMLPEWFLTDVDLRQNQLINAVAENRTSAPANPVKGQLWMDTSTTPGVLKYFDGAQWTGGRAYYSTVADDGTNKPQHGRLNFRSTTSIDAAVADEASSDTSSVTLAAKYGTVVPSLLSGEQANSGTAQTLARSDHVHGSPSSSGADTVLISWWQRDQQLWTQLVPPATFVPDLPGITVGGGWLLTSPGSTYWAGSPVPVSRTSIYRNSVRVSTVGGPAQVTVGWRCFDADSLLLGQVKCINSVAIDSTTETGALVARNYVPNPSGEGPLYGPEDGWHSNAFFGTGSIATVLKSADRASTGTYSVKAIWPDPTPGTVQSYCVIRVPNLTPGTQMTLTGRVYVPAGSPDVKLDVTFFATSATISLKNQWVDVSVPFTVPTGTSNAVYVGVTTLAPVAGGVAYLDDVMVRVGTAPLPDGRTYFDGNTAGSETTVFAWDGDPDNSTSAYYTVEPSWEIIEGYIGVGDGPEPVLGEAASVEEAVNPPENTVYFQPFVAATSGALIVDTHEVARGQRDLTVLDGLNTGWVNTEGTASSHDVTTNDIAPPDTEPPSTLRIGPLEDPPRSASDAVARAYLERALGSIADDTTGEMTPPAPQFQFSGDGGVAPTPADLGYLFASWPLWSLWLDTSVRQVRPMLVAGTSQGTGNQPCPLVAAFTQLPNSYAVTIIPPVSGLLLGVSTGSAIGQYDDYMELRCTIESGVDADGNGGTAVGYSGSALFSGDSNTQNARQGYTLLNAVAATPDVRYRVCTMYTHGGPSAAANRDRAFVLFLPGVRVAP